jgi:DNA polymerase (family X)
MSPWVPARRILENALLAPSSHWRDVPTDLDNASVAAQLEAFAALLELAEATPYAARAYRRAAATIRDTPAPILELVRQGRERELRGIGPGISAKLRELGATGEIAELEELRSRARPELVGLGRLLGIAPQRMVEIATALDVETPDDFRRAAAEGALQRVPGIGPSTERKILERLAAEPGRPRQGLLLPTARELVEGIAAALGGEISGDPRRWADLSFDLAVVVPSARPAETIDAFARLPQIVTVVERTERFALGVTIEGAPVALHVPEPSRFGTELVRATGAAAYVEALGPLPDASDEGAVFATLGIPWCPPELREGAFRGQPPSLVELDDVRGDLHCHTTWSDGRASVLEMATAARDLGHDYLAICDHTPSVRVVPGLDAGALRRQADEIREANEQLAPFRVLRGVEVDILPGGGLDLPDDVLAELDWVQLSLHAGQREAGRSLTAKVVAAMRHPAVRCLSHPKGRILNHRPPNALELETVIEVALEHGVALEVNGLPSRLDLAGPDVRLAVEAGVPVVVSTDAHSAAGLGNLRLAVATARRGWATAADVLNTRPLDEVLAHRR